LKRWAILLILLFIALSSATIVRTQTAVVQGRLVVSPSGNATIYKGRIWIVPGKSYVLEPISNSTYAYAIFDCAIVLNGTELLPSDPWLSQGKYRAVFIAPPGISNGTAVVPSNCSPPYTLWVDSKEVPWSDWAIYNLSGTIAIFVNVKALNLTYPAFLYLYCEDPSGIYPENATSVNATFYLFNCSKLQSQVPATTTTYTTSATVTATPNPTYGLPEYTITINIPTPPPITLFHPSIPTIWTAAGLLWLAIFLALFVGLSRLIPWYTALVIASFVLMTMAIMMWTSYSSYAIAAGVIGIIIGLALTKTRGGY